MLIISYKQISIITNVVLFSSLLLLTTSLLTMENHQALARCPNGTHKSPSGVCEQVVPHAGLPRCPNGTHRSPAGICEQVESSSTKSASPESNANQGSTNFGHNGNSVSGQPSSLAPSSTATAAATTSSNKCDQSLWNHVYNPSRLQVVDNCKAVSGVIDSIRAERDGDYHIRLKLDPQFSDLINSANVNGQFGDLVVEPICVNPVTQLDAISACQDFHQNIDVPTVGTHIQVTGSYVLDKEHGGWAEIHPVTSISISNIP
jgi:hypothetical protein